MGWEIFLFFWQELFRNVFNSCIVVSCIIQRQANGFSNFLYTHATKILRTHFNLNLISLCELLTIRICLAEFNCQIICEEGLVVDVTFLDCLNVSK